MKTKNVFLICSLFFLCTTVSAQENTAEFIPFDQSANTSTVVQTGHSSVVSGQQTVSCLELIRYQREQAGKFDETDSEMVKNVASKQTTPGAIGGLGFSAASGLTAGLVTGNPVIGVGVFGAMGLVTTIGTAIERGKIKRNGNIMLAAEKVQSGREDTLTKKERKAFERARKKVSKKVYKDKNYLDRYDFAHTVNQQAGTGENLFCDIDRKGRVVIKPQDRETYKRLALAQKCKEEKRGNTRAIARR